MKKCFHILTFKYIIQVDSKLLMRREGTATKKISSFDGVFIALQMPSHNLIEFLLATCFPEGSDWLHVRIPIDNLS